MHATANRRWLVVAAAAIMLVIGVAVIQPAFGGEQVAPQPQEAVAVLSAAQLARAEIVPAEMQSAGSASSSPADTQDTPAADTPSSDNCIACHTNQTLLQQLAVEPETVESELASGEG